jgi:hypothetical protein
LSGDVPVTQGPGIWTPGGEYRPKREEEQAAEAEPAREPTPEEVAELMRQLRVGDFLLSNLSSLAQLAYAKLDPASRDLGDARLAIDAMRALVPVLEGVLPPDVARDFAQVVTNLQLAYVQVAEEQGGEGAGGDG